MDAPSRLHILFLPFWRWYPNGVHPAQGAAVRELARAVSRLHRVTVLCVEPGDRPRRREARTDAEEDGIRTIRISHRRLPVPFCTYAWYLWRVKREFAGLWEAGLRPDLIHAHEYAAGVAAVMAGKSWNLPVVISEHCGDFIRGTLRKRDILKARFAMNRAAAVLPVGEEVRQSLRALRIGGRFEVVPNAIDTAVFRPAPARAAARDGKATILLVALLREGKGIPVLLRALAALKRKRRDFLLQIAGEGPGGGKYRSLCRDLGLDGEVSFLGMKSRPEVAELIRGSAFVVQPSLCETFGMTAIEAMACGKPLVASRLPAFERTVSPERGLLVPPGDAAALASALDAMLDRRRGYSPERIARYVEENFSYEVVGRRLDAVYRSALAVGGGAPS
jgi:glycosyltransferase involved in cell wall biosynthesis